MIDQYNQDYLERFIVGVLIQKPWYRKYFFFNEKDFTNSQYGHLAIDISSMDDTMKTADNLWAPLLAKGHSAVTIGSIIAEGEAHLVTPPVDFENMCRRLRDSMVRRELKEQIPHMTTNEIVQYANELGALTEKYDEKSLRQALSEYYDEYIEMQERKQRGEDTHIVTGMKKFDVDIRLDHNLFMALGARTSIGKSLFALHIALEAAKRGKHVYYLNLEMGNREILNRSLAIMAKGQSRDYQSHTADIDKAVNSLEPVLDRIVLNSSAGMTTADVRQAVMSKRDCDLLIIDYLNLLTDKADAEHQRLTQIANKIKGLSSERNIAIIGCCQLNRDAEKAQREPFLYDIKDSSGIEMAADVVALIHRERDKSAMTLFVRKHRLGMETSIEYLFDSSTTTYFEQI